MPCQNLINKNKLRINFSEMLPHPVYEVSKIYIILAKYPFFAADVSK